ncbi:MAG TPA: HigA family addiction module antitoxin [Bacteroidia bacterium]|jgi:addiction module HigA family antidote|nr:HigA family addiction module antitoxin [Bacteroidia bacterium]
METKELVRNQVPVSPIHPGTLLQDEIKYRGILQEELAAWMKIEPAELLTIMGGDKGINAEFALKVETTIGVDANYWLYMQAKYDIDTLRIKEWKENPELAEDAISGSAAITAEPKSLYISVGKRATAQFVSEN